MVAQRALQSIIPSGEAGANVFTKSVLFTETVANSVFTGTILIPPGAILLDIIVTPLALWDGTSTKLKVGDATDDDGWFTDVDLLTGAEAILGERLIASAGTDYWGGVNGAYLVAATGRFGAQTGAGLGIGGYYATAGSVIGVVTKTAATGTGIGRTLLTVVYIIPTQLAATATTP